MRPLIALFRTIVVLMALYLAASANGQGVFRQMWTNLPTGPGNTLTVLTNTSFNPNWPDNPAVTFTRVFTNFETEINVRDNYGQRLRAFVVPPTNGTYTFWIASDDSSHLFLSSDEQPANMTRIASVDTWANSREWIKEANQQSAGIPLEAGRRYYIEAIMQEGTGGDNLAVRWRLPNGVFEEPLSAISAAGTRLIPCTGTNSTPGFFLQPTNKTVAELANATFSVLATNQAPVSYQWQRNGTNLNGATLPVLTVSNVNFLADNGKIFRCVVSNPSGSVTSSPATLTVIADTVAPTLESAVNQDLSHVMIGFSEPVEAASATNPANYSINFGVTVLGAALVNPQTVNLTVSPLTLSNNYTVTVNNIRDTASIPNTIAPDSQIVFQAQSYGLEIRPAIGPFLDNQIPTAAPALSGNWTAVVAFTNLAFTNALGLAAVPGTSNLIVWEREGRIWMFTNSPSASVKTLVLDISDRCQGWDDSGLLNVVFHPGFVTNRHIFVYYTWVPPGTVVGSPSQRPPQFLTDAYHDRLSRFTLDANGVEVPNSEQMLIDQTGTSTWHNGSGMFFHPANGFLYVVIGDDADNANNQRITNTLHSGIWRLDVDKRGGSISHPIPRQPFKGVTTNYYIPNDNPFVGVPNALEEFFAIGLRSPHRMTYDPPSGRIFIGDVGQGSREEITVIEPTDPPGLNLQWTYVEGFLGTMPGSYIGVSKPPILDYTHGEGSAVIGGYVYRGAEFAADLGGKYVFADNVTRRIWALDESTSPASKILLCVMPNGPGNPPTGPNYLGLSSFGIDHNNELYFCQMGNLGGRIYKLARTGPPAGQPFPPLLSQTGVFTNLLTMAPNPGLIPFTVNSPLWSDGAVKTRWMALPTNQFIQFASTGEWTFPNGSVFVKHFDLPVDDTNPNILRRLETRLLARDTNGAAYGITYRWRTNYTDADLVTNGLTENILISTGAGLRTQQWYYPSPADCLRCHTPAADYVLGVKTRQLNGEFPYTATGVTDNQLRAWNHIGLFDAPLNDASIPTYDKLVPVTDASSSLTNRVRSYLDANCSQCHRPGGSPVLWDARYDTPLANQGIINGTVGSDLGIPGARVVVPQDVAKSIMHARMNSLESFKMPPLARNTIDSNAVAALSEWISSMVIPPILSAAHYEFEGNADDTSGNGNHGTANNVTWVPGRVGAQAAQFNGTSSYVQIPRSIGTNFTVALWLRTTNSGGAGTQWWSGKGLVDGEVNGGNNDWGAAVVNSRFVLGAGTPDTTVASSVNVNDGAWHHVAATRDAASGVIEVYVDGILRGSGIAPTGSKTAAPNLRIGSIQTGSANGFLNGTIDEVLLYDRVLTPGEIAALSTPPAAPTGLAAVAGDGQVGLNWLAPAGAMGYHVKRSTTSGGPYSVVATNSSVTFTNTGLSNGVLYYFVVSALNAFGESANSSEASARPVSLTPAAMTFVGVDDLVQIGWPADHVGWRLQAQTNAPGAGLSTNWTTVPGSVLTNQMVLPINPTNGSVFFRLVYP